MKYLALGERLKALRAQKALSPAQLAEVSGLPESEIVSYEEGEETPKIAQLITLSRALDVNVAEIFRDRPQTSPFEILRKEQRERVSPWLKASTAKIKDYAYELLTYPGENKHLDAYMIEVPPRQGRKPYDDLTHAGEEFFYVLEGRLLGEFAGEKVEINTGDSIYFRSQTPHCIYNPYEAQARALVVIYPF